MRGALVGLLIALVAPSGALADEALWALLREGGHAVAIRHARAPGTGDPPGFRLEDCATQRNLSAEGRAQARVLGAAFQARGVPVGRVLSSRWCRALETARLAFGQAEPEPALDSFFGERPRAAQQTEAVRTIIGAWPRNAGTLVLVTHQVNITALGSGALAEGEMIVLAAQDGAVRVVGRLAP